MWLLSLETNIVDRIYLPDFTSMQQFKTHIDNYTKDDLIFNRIITHLGLHSFVFGASTLTDNVLILISGSIEFINSFQYKGAPFIYVYDEPMRIRRKIVSSSCPLHQIKHTQCGGATSYTTVWSSNISSLTPHSTSIRRNIGDYIDHSIRPRAAPASLPAVYYSETSLLKPDFFDTPVVYATNFVSSRLGLRSLSIAELSKILGLPSWIYHFPLKLHDLSIVPTQILDALLRPALNTTVMTESKRRKLPPLIHEPDRIFLPDLNAFLTSDWKHSAQEFDTSVKHDDAETNMDLWDKRNLCIFPEAQSHHLEILRKFFFRWSVRRIYKEYTSYLRHKYKRHYDNFLQNKVSHRKLQGGSVADTMATRLRDEISSGTSALYHYASASYSKWDAGSSLFYWRWHPSLQGTARNGFPGLICGPLPTNKRPTRRPKKGVYQLLLQKILSFLHKKYLIIKKSCEVINNIDYFAVPKGLADIRPVFNGTSCGFNGVVFAPNFWLPISITMTRALHYNYKVVDIDLGEMFINFPLHPTLIPYSGVDVTPFKDDILNHYPELKHQHQDDPRLFLAWTRCWMGFRPSPEWAARFYYFAEEFVRGDESALTNICR